MNELRNKDNKVIRLTDNGINENLVLIFDFGVIFTIKKIINNRKSIIKLIVSFNTKLERLLIKKRIIEEKVIFREYKHRKEQIIDRLFAVLNIYFSKIIFVIPPTTSKEVFETKGSPNEYEKIQEYKNNIFWSFDLKNYRKSNWWSKTASTEISDKITITTANTMKKILEICKK